MIPPEEFHLDAVKKADGTWCVLYEEVFSPSAEHALANTMALCKALESAHPESGMVFSNPAPLLLRIEMPASSLGRLANVMVGEFMQWGTVGQTKLCDLLGGYASATQKLPTAPADEPLLPPEPSTQA